MKLRHSCRTIKKTKTKQISHNSEVFRTYKMASIIALTNNGNGNPEATTRTINSPKKKLLAFPA